MKQPSYKHRGFTVLELLVSALIIAGLAVLASYGMQSLGARGTRVRCVNNLRQIGVGIAAYAAEHRGEWPYFKDNRPNATKLGTWISRGMTDENGWVGIGQIYPYLRDKRLFICPAHKERLAALIQLGDFNTEEGTFRTNYCVRGFNQSFNPDTPNLKSLATMDRRALVACNFAYAASNPVNFPLSWHEGTYPVLFSDGSISAISFPRDAVNTMAPPSINDSTSMQMRVWDFFDGKTNTLAL